MPKRNTLKIDGNDELEGNNSNFVSNNDEFVSNNGVFMRNKNELTESDKRRKKAEYDKKRYEQKKRDKLQIFDNNTNYSKNIESNKNGDDNTLKKSENKLSITKKVMRKEN